MYGPSCLIQKGGVKPQGASGAQMPFCRCPCDRVTRGMGAQKTPRCSERGLGVIPLFPENRELPPGRWIYSASGPEKAGVPRRGRAYRPLSCEMPARYSRYVERIGLGLEDRIKSGPATAALCRWRKDLRPATCRLPESAVGTKYSASAILPTKHLNLALTTYALPFSRPFAAQLCVLPWRSVSLLSFNKGSTPASRACSQA